MILSHTLSSCSHLELAKVNLKVKVPAGSENPNELYSGNKSLRSNRLLKVKPEALREQGEMGKLKHKGRKRRFSSRVGAGEPCYCSFLQSSLPVKVIPVHHPPARHLAHKHTQMKV